MVEQKTTKLEREYIIPLRRAWINVPEYKRTRKAIKTIKIFIARHMKVPERNLDNVKLDVYFNNDVWFRGKASPPSKVKVKAVKEGDIVKVTFASTPAHVNFLKLKHAKFHKEADKKPSKTESKTETKTEVKATEQKTEEQKVDEKEKEKAGEQQDIKQASAEAKAEKHTTKVKEPKIQRMAMKR